MDQVWMRYVLRTDRLLVFFTAKSTLFSTFTICSAIKKAATPREIATFLSYFLYLLVPYKGKL